MARDNMPNIVNISNGNEDEMPSIGLGPYPCRSEDTPVTFNSNLRQTIRSHQRRQAFNNNNVPISFQQLTTMNIMQSQPRRSTFQATSHTRERPADLPPRGLFDFGTYPNSRPPLVPPRNFSGYFDGPQKQAPLQQIPLNNSVPRPTVRVDPRLSQEAYQPTVDSSRSDLNNNANETISIDREAKRQLRNFKDLMKRYHVDDLLQAAQYYAVLYELLLWEILARPSVTYIRRNIEGLAVQIAAKTYGLNITANEAHNLIMEYYKRWCPWEDDDSLCKRYLKQFQARNKEKIGHSGFYYEIHIPRARALREQNSINENEATIRFTRTLKDIADVSRSAPPCPPVANTIAPSNKLNKARADAPRSIPPRPPVPNRPMNNLFNCPSVPNRTQLDKYPNTSWTQNTVARPSSYYPPNPSVATKNLATLRASVADSSTSPLPCNTPGNLKPLPFGFSTSPPLNSSGTIQFGAAPFGLSPSDSTSNIQILSAPHKLPLPSPENLSQNSGLPTSTLLKKRLSSLSEGPSSKAPRLLVSPNQMRDSIIVSTSSSTPCDAIQQSEPEDLTLKKKDLDETTVVEDTTPLHHSTPVCSPTSLASQLSQTFVADSQNSPLPSPITKAQSPPSIPSTPKPNGINTVLKVKKRDVIVEPSEEGSDEASDVTMGLVIDEDHRSPEEASKKVMSPEKTQEPSDSTLEPKEIKSPTVMENEVPEELEKETVVVEDKAVSPPFKVLQNVVICSSQDKDEASPPQNLKIVSVDTVRSSSPESVFGEPLKSIETITRELREAMDRSEFVLNQGRYSPISPPIASPPYEPLSPPRGASKEPISSQNEPLTTKDLLSTQEVTYPLTGYGGLATKEFTLEGDIKSKRNSFRLSHRYHLSHMDPNNIHSQSASKVNMEVMNRNSKTIGPLNLKSKQETIGNGSIEIQAPQGKLCYSRATNTLLRYYDSNQRDQFETSLADGDYNDKNNSKEDKDRTEYYPLPPTIEFSHKEKFTDPPEYVDEVALVDKYAPLDFASFYLFVTRYQIFRRHDPISFQTFLVMYNTNGLPELLDKHKFALRNSVKVSNN